MCIGGINLGAIQFTLTSALTAETPVFTLTLTSTGGPTTTVTWERDTVELTDNDEYTISQIVVDTVQAEYSNQLTVTGRLTGDYRCMVFNIRGDASRQLDIESKLVGLIMSILSLLCMSPVCKHPSHLMLS